MERVGGAEVHPKQCLSAQWADLNPFSCVLILPLLHTSVSTRGAAAGFLFLFVCCSVGVDSIGETDSLELMAWEIKVVSLSWFGNMSSFT